MPDHPTPPIALDAANGQAHFATTRVDVSEDVIAQLRATGATLSLDH